MGQRILVGALKTPSSRVGITTIYGHYGHVFSDDLEADLNREVARVSTWVTAQGYSIDRVVT